MPTWVKFRCLLTFFSLVMTSQYHLPTHNRQVPCSSQGRATIFLLQIIELPQAHRLIDFGSHPFLSEKHPVRLFCTQSAAAWFDTLPITDACVWRNFGGERNCGTLRVIFETDSGLGRGMLRIERFTGWVGRLKPEFLESWNPWIVSIEQIGSTSPYCGSTISIIRQVCAIYSHSSFYFIAQWLTKIGLWEACWMVFLV
jgi:hypothetical protein